jgi:hypothetical protein
LTTTEVRPVPAGLRLARVRVHEIGGAGGVGKLADLASLHVEPGGVDHRADQGTSRRLMLLNSRDPSLKIWSDL